VKLSTQKSLQKISVALTTLIIMFGLSACVQEVPLVSESAVTSVETLDEQRAWLEQQADAVVAASEIPEGWHQRGHIPEENVPWSALPEDRARVIGRLSPIECGGRGTGRLDLGLNNDIAVPDITVVADRMRAAWTAEGWTVSDITDPSPGQIYFRADRPDGAIMGFRATPDLLLIEISGTCSAHVSMGSDFGAPLEANEFEKELAAREQAADADSSSAQ